MTKPNNILVLADPQLQQAIDAIISSSDTKVIYWQKNASTPNTLAEQAWQSEQEWDIVFSVYSDYILPPHALASIRIPLNIHPALPSYPGVGYDILPLIREDQYCGATIHWMEEQIDRGLVLDTKTVTLPKHTNYPEIRKLNQSAVIDLFQKWFALATSTTGINPLEKIQCLTTQENGWIGPYTSSKNLVSELALFRQNHPNKWQRLKIPHKLLHSLGPA